MTIDNLHDIEGLTDDDRKVLIQFVPGTTYNTAGLSSLAVMDEYDVGQSIAVLLKRGFIRAEKRGGSKWWVLTDAGAAASLAATA